MPPRVLILFAHPALQKSRVHRVLADAVAALPGVTFHDLYERYPDFFMDAKAEQALLLAHDVIIFQHPFYWYSAPAIVKEWQDHVLQHGFAYGEGGTALRGKLTLSVLTTGGPEESYRADTGDHFTVRQLLAPFEQTARQCGMDYLPPCVFHGTDGLDDGGLTAVAAEYVRLVAALRDGAIDIPAGRHCERLNAELDRLITAGSAA
jgi:glutathione-regulated potassium-efflux system ancillary protein KefG